MKQEKVLVTLSVKKLLKIVESHGIKTVPAVHRDMVCLVDHCNTKA